ncbi:GGDEF domain-containing phosphodiesterase [Paenibacillus sp. LHD-117]|uniref:bifunctional diguanylate cyclase/phosphodiesterase n=1 Tax=Paenibacillus sp. LHD-117 TaxID=3071412 RepID=UPI0027E1661B|nr:GGDEF domain-containing phosphodiesterase [Paenibacillus sp. LHD-117]MDQ6423187.1 GGDEF domain-containing phosphodiesterase [Paenibacillus sp. LHD-117]
MGCSTQLLSRKEAYALIELSVQQARAGGKRLMIAIAQFDRFYRVVDTRDTAFGQYVLDVMMNRLGETGKLLTGSEPPVLCNWGSNAVLYILQENGDSELCWQAADAVKYAVERPIPEGSSELYLTSSIGVCYFPQDGLTSETLICRAESALQQAKDDGGNRISFYHSEDTNRMNRRIAVETGLRPALYQRQFHLSYQPIYRLQDGRLRGLEALIRWNHPELGVVSPNEFIPIAEQNGLIVPIGEWVIRESCKMLARIRKYGLRDLRMSINISPVQLQDMTFTSTVLNVLEENGLEPGSIELEITEHYLFHSSETAIASLSRLRAAGVRIALDDFGTGYSSFSNLKQLPIHCLKIDKSFIEKIDLQGAERHIVEAIIGLVQKLGIEVVAEGVEYEGQYRLLKEWGCDFVQGYLLGQPMEPTMMDTTMFRRTEREEERQADPCCAYEKEETPAAEVRA